MGGRPAYLPQDSTGSSGPAPSAPSSKRPAYLPQEPFDPRIDAAAPKKGLFKKAIVGEVKDIGKEIAGSFKRFGQDVAEGAYGAAASSSDLFRGVNKLIPSVVPGYGKQKKATLSFLKKLAGAARQRATEVGVPEEEKAFMDKMYRSGAHMGFSLPKYAVATMAGGPITGFAGMSGLEAHGRDAPPKEIAVETARGGTTGAVFKGAGPLAPAYRAPALGVGLGGQTALEGGTPEQIAESGVSGLVLGALGGRRGMTPRQLFTRPLTLERAETPTPKQLETIDRVVKGEAPPEPALAAPKKGLLKVEESIEPKIEKPIPLAEKTSALTEQPGKPKKGLMKPGGQKAGKQPWEMTKGEFEEGVALRGTSPMGRAHPQSPSSGQIVVGEKNVGKGFYKSDAKRYSAGPGGKLHIFSRADVKETQPGVFTVRKGAKPILTLRGDDVGLSPHKASVEAALREGKPVPAEVLKQYPDLKPPGTSAIGHPLGKEVMVPMPVEGRPMKPVGASDIVHHVRETFNVPIRIGKYRHKALGLFKVKPEVIRLREDGMVSTTAHELGHAMEKWVYGWEKGYPKHFRAFHEEIIAMGKELYGTRKPAAGYTREGYAEFMKHWLYTGEAAVKAPKFTKFFEEVFLKENPDIAVRLNQTRQLIRNYMEQGAEGRVLGQIDIEAKGARVPIMEKVAHVKRRVQGLFTDQLQPIEYAVRQMIGKAGSKKLAKEAPHKHPYELAIAVAKSSEAKAYEMVMHHTFDLGLNKTGPGLKQVLAPVSKHIKPFLAYAYARRAIELHKRGINPGIMLADAEYVYTKYAREPGFEKAAQGVADWNNRVLDYLVEAGGLSAEGKAIINDANVAYLPLKRVFLEGELGTVRATRGFVDQASPIKRIKGSGRKIKNPLHAMISQTANIIATADKIRVAKSMVALAEQTEGGGMWAERLPAPLKGQKFKVEDIKRQLEKSGVDLTEADMDAVLTVFTSGKSYYGKDNIVSITRNGKQEFWQLDAELYRSMKGLDIVTLPWFVNLVFGVPSRMVRLGATGLRPGFSLITNPARDIFTYMMQSVRKFAHPGQAAKGLYREVRTKEEAIRFKRGGGEIAQPLGLDRKLLKRAADELLANTKREKAWHIVKHPIEILREVFSFTEAASRIAESAYVAKQYPKGSEAGAVAAAKAAAEVTVNFRRMGTYGSVLNQLIAFWNPAVQGISKFGRTIQESPVKSTTRAMAMITAPMLALWWLHKDEKWYQERPLWEKLIFAHFKIGDTIHRYPLPFEWGVMFGSIPVAFFDSWYHKDPQLLKDSLMQAGESMAPPMVPSLIGPAEEVEGNYARFRERPIVPAGKKRLLPGEQYTRGTTETAKKFGRKIGYSPAKIEHLVGGYTGGLGMDFLRFYDQMTTEVVEDAKRIKEPADLPVVGRMFSRKQGASYSVNRVYEVFEEYQRLDATLRRLSKERKNPDLSPQAKKEAQARFDSLAKKIPKGKDGKQLNEDEFRNRVTGMREDLEAVREYQKNDQWDDATRVARNILDTLGIRKYGQQPKSFLKKASGEYPWR